MRVEVCICRHFMLWNTGCQISRLFSRSDFEYVCVCCVAGCRCVTRRKQSKPSSTQDPNRQSTQHRTTATCFLKKQCRPDETKPNTNAIHPRKRHNNPTHSHTPGRITTHVHGCRCVVDNAWDQLVSIRLGGDIHWLMIYTG